MCRNITELRGLEPPATTEEIEAAARQYVRKVSGFTRPSSANAQAFEAAVAQVAATTTRLLAAAAPDSTDDRFVVRAAAKVVAALPVNRPDNITAIQDLHIWTAESVRRDRLDFRPKHRLAVLVVQAIPLLTPVELPRVAD